jgi:hypothetical protein
MPRMHAIGGTEGTNEPNRKPNGLLRIARETKRSGVARGRNASNLYLQSRSGQYAKTIF